MKPTVTIRKSTRAVFGGLWLITTGEVDVNGTKSDCGEDVESVMRLMEKEGLIHLHIIDDDVEPIEVSVVKEQLKQLTQGGVVCVESIQS